MWKTNYCTSNLLLKSSNNFFVVVTFIGPFSFIFLDLPRISNPCSLVLCSMCEFLLVTSWNSLLSQLLIHACSWIASKLSECHVTSYCARLSPTLYVFFKAHSLLPDASQLFSLRLMLDDHFNFEFFIGNLNVCLCSSDLFSSFWPLISTYLKYMYMGCFIIYKLAVLKSFSFLWPVHSIVCPHSICLLNG